MSWSNEAVIQFLKLYKREQVIWDPKHINHRNRSEVNDAWHRIQSELNVDCSVVDLKKKKESLMTTYRLHYNRKKSGESYRVMWFAYDLMSSFLSGRYESGIPENETIGENVHTTRTSQVGRSDKYVAFENKYNVPVTSNSMKLRHSKLKRESQSSIQNTTDIATENVVTDDEYELYGQLLAKKLRKLDERQRDIAMHEIDNIMFRAKMQSGSSQSTEYSSLSSPAPEKPKSPLFIVTSPSQQQQYEDENIGHCEVFTREPNRIH